MKLQLSGNQLENYSSTPSLCWTNHISYLNFTVLMGSNQSCLNGCPDIGKFIYSYLYFYFVVWFDHKSM